MMEIADGDGKAIVSTMTTDRAATDPIAGRLLANMVSQALK